MGKRVLTVSFLFLLVTLLSAPWLRSDDQGVPHFNATPAKGDKLERILDKDQLRERTPSFHIRDMLMSWPRRFRR